ncbi:MAG TPA: c-type cytochrome biogenesis protein CcmI [Candidatus Marinimicrobia bacterium]|nr:c-type cytochrome biogenesis protein CcmI [Candidatus Neomarinimicrobiota bacterium]
MDSTFGILISLAAIVFTFLPLLRKGKTISPVDRLHRNRESLEFDLENLETHLRELEFDFKMGILDSEDYKESKGEVQQQIDTIHKELTGEKDSKKTLSCPSCGAAVKAHNKFCKSCGHPLK